MIDKNELNDLKKENKNLKKILLSIFIVCFIIVSIIFFGNLYMKSNDLVFIRFKINPEFGFVVNGNGDVVNYISLNKDANNIYERKMFVGLKFDQALEKSIDIAKKNNYLVDENEKNIEFTIMSEEEKVQEKYETQIVNKIEEKDSSIKANAVEPSKEEIENYEQITIDDKKDKEEQNDKKDKEEQSDSSSIPSIAYQDCKYTNVKYTDLTGEGRWQTAINVSKAMYPNGTKSGGVILLKYDDLIDGYLSVLLSKNLNAPILFIGQNGDNNKIHTITYDEINRLMKNNKGDGKIYVIGGKDTISDSTIVDLEKHSYKVERISGANRIVTSLEVAKKVYSTKKFDSIILAPFDNESIDAAMVASSTTASNYPIIYNNNDKLNPEVSLFIKENNIKKVYIIGKNKFTNMNSVLSSLENLKVSYEFIVGEDRYDTSTLSVKKFNSSFKNVVLVNNLVDIITASALANKNDSALIYAAPNSNSPSIIYDNQLSILDNKNNINSLYYLGGDDIKAAFRKVLFKIKERNVSTCDNPKMELLFSKNNAVFYVPHQDDETLYYGQTITAAINKLGSNHVYVVLLTDGAASGAQNNSEIKNALSNYNKKNNINLTFSQARDIEYKAALEAMGVRNILYMEDFNLKRLKDGGYSKTNNLYNSQINDTKKLMQKIHEKFKGDVTHFTYSTLDDHVDHAGHGDALTQLYYDYTIADNMYEESYLIVKSTEMIDDFKHVTPDVTAKKYTSTTIIPNNLGVILDYKNGFNDIKKAFNKYGYYADKSKCTVNGDLFGIGCVSVRNLFERINTKMDSKTNSLKTVIHIPYEKQTNLEIQDSKINYAKTKLSGKTVSIYGDSISSFEGYSNNITMNKTIGSNVSYYKENYKEIDKKRYFIDNVDKTWWMKVINRLDLKLLVNNSDTGDKVSGTKERYKQLHSDTKNQKPDIIFIYIGTNDYLENVPVTKFESSYDKMLNYIKTNYSKSEIYVLNLVPNGMNKSTSLLVSYNIIIKQLTTKYSVNLININSSSGITSSTLSTYMSDVNKVHPSEEGMNAIANTVLQTISDKYLK